MQRRFVMVCIAIAVACVDLADKALAHPDYKHVRSPFVVLLTGVVMIGLVAFVPRIASRAAFVGAAVAVGGALGNVIASIVWTHGVPDPLVVGGADGGLTCNLADAFVFTGDALLLSAVVIYALRNRARLHTTM